MPDKCVKSYDPDEVPFRKNVFKDGMMGSDEMWLKTYTFWDYLLLVCLRPAFYGAMVETANQDIV